jgi:hypothetical protein
MNLACLARFWQEQNGPNTALVRGRAGLGLKNSGASRVKILGRHIVRIPKPDCGVTFWGGESLLGREAGRPAPTGMSVLLSERLAGARAYVMVDGIRGGAASGPIVYSNWRREFRGRGPSKSVRILWELLDLQHRCPIFPRCGLPTTSVEASP